MVQRKVPLAGYSGVCSLRNPSEGVAPSSDWEYGPLRDPRERTVKAVLLPLPSPTLQCLNAVGMVSTQGVSRVP